MSNQEEIEAIIADYQKMARDEIIRDEINTFPSPRKLRLVSFVSHSNGRNRSKRRAREVNFLVVSSPIHDTITYPIIHGEIRPTRKRSAPNPDELANEILFYLPPDERTAEMLLERTLDRARKRKLFK